MRPALLLFLLLAPTLLRAQAPAGWEACAAIGDAPQRLACFDRWAAQQGSAATAASPAPAAAPAAAGEPLPARAPTAAVPGTVVPRLTALEGCRDTRHSELSRSWELERSSDCGTFGLRSLRPLAISLATADTVNRQPTSDNPANNVGTAAPYRTTEMRLQFSARSKLAANLLVPAGSPFSDSLWFAYSQQSYWQLFTPGISRPFRSTDHEPELLYIHPLDASALGWRLRFGGVGVVHHSNGQSLPYSRSWNRAYLLAGAERGALNLQARIWRRIDEDRSNDDNPGISDWYGRAQLQASWRPNNRHLLAATLRHNLRASGRGALRLEWFRTLAEGAAGPAGGLQLHTQLFTGYGDTLLDYNRRRTVFTIGLSLAEW